jgi:hypothetical protein
MIAIERGFFISFARRFLSVVGGYRTNDASMFGAYFVEQQNKAPALKRSQHP